MISLKDKNFVPFISAEKIQTEIELIAKQIKKDFEEKNPLFISVLSGAFMFSADLIRAVEIQSEIQFIKLHSYEGMESSGNIHVDLDLGISIEGRSIIILEDIIDTGTTLNFLLQHLKTKNLSELKIATLLLKPDALKFQIKPDYVCFEIENKFVVGYGLDYDGLGRNLKDIYVLA